ncbi:MAG: tyrosine--tRNA ligase [Bacteroidetes bacterium]|nr:tyrosine--tRNA ligase [Bacteroidota bacterium]MBK7970616.1 tyrosine--tRNA ligase [Bacteroidota bacterium]
MNFIEELRWKGMIHDMMPGTEELLSKGMVSGYIGFDPTADSLHIGNLVQIILLMNFQRAGHKPFALVGGATGMVGDPSGKSEERNLLDEKTLQHNIACVQKQLEKFLNFNCGANSAEMVNNYDWFKGMGFLEFIRDTGKHISVNYMMAKDSVKKRLETGLSFTEFTYQLVQGYDFYWLYKNKGCRLQMGGSDQWGNIVTGTELIRRKDGGEAFAMTSPLITKSDGSKFGKTEKGNVWLDAEKTSPYQFYQFWLNSSDEDSKRFIRIFTFLSKEEVMALEADHDSAPQNRALQKRLAKELTTMVHSEQDYLNSVEASGILFGQDTADQLKNLEEKLLLEIMDGVPQMTVSKNDLQAGVGIVDLLAEKTNIFPSKGEAKKMVMAGGVSINKVKVADTNVSVTTTDLLRDKYLILQKGKKQYYLLTAI